MTDPGVGAKLIRVLLLALTAAEVVDVRAANPGLSQDQVAAIVKRRMDEWLAGHTTSETP